MAAGRAFPIRAASAPPPDDTTPAPTVAAPDPAPATTVAAPDTTAAPATTVAAPDTTAAPATTAPPATTTPDTDPPAATTTIAAAPEPTTPDTTPAPTSTVAVADSETETTDAPASTSPATVVIDQSAPSTSTVTNPPDPDTTPPTGTVPSSDGVDSTSSVGPGTVASVSTPLDGGGPGAVLGAPGTTIPAVAGGPVTLGLAPPAAVVSQPSTWAILLGFGANTLRFGADGSVSFGSETHWLDTIWNIDITGTAGDDSLTIALDAGAAPDVAVGYHGQGGADTLVGPTGGSWMSQWTVNGIDAGAGSLDVGDLGVGFDGVEHLVGGSGRDDFVLANTAPALAASAAIPTSTVTIDGGAGANSLHGPAFDTIWTIDGPDRGHVAGVGFENIGSLVGAPGNHDSFVIQPTGSVSGTIAGGAGGYDSIIANGGVDSVRYSIGQVFGDGVLGLDARTFSFTGMEPVDIHGPVGTVTFQGSTGDDVVDLHALSGQADLVNEISGTSDGLPFEVLRFANPTDKLVLELLGGTDDVTVTSLDAAFAASLAIFGQDEASQNRPCDPATIPTGGCSPEASDTDVTFAGDIALDGGNIDVVARTITVKPGVTVSTVSSDPDGEDGYITFWARQFGVTVLESIDPSIVSTGDKSVSITLGAGSKVEGGEVFLLAYAEDRTLGELAAPPGAAIVNTVVNQLGDKLATFEALPFKLIHKTSTASVTLGSGAQLLGSGTVGIFVTAQAEASGQATSELFSLGLAIANATATINIGDNAVVRAGDAVNIVSSADVTAKMKTSTKRDLGAVPQDPTETALSFAVAIADLTSTATLADTAVIEAGRTVNFRALGTKASEAEAESGMYADGTASISGAVQVSDATVTATVGGRITANMEEADGPVAGVVKLEFDPTVGPGQIGYVDGVNNTIFVGHTALVTGDSVTYSNRHGTSIGGLAQPSGLANGKQYYVINVADDPTTPFDESQTIQLASNELNSYRGTAVNLSCDGFDPLGEHCVAFTSQATTNTKTFNAAAVNAATNTITVANPYFASSSGLAPDFSLLGNSFGLGQAVAYHANGQAPIPGLVDGATYYVIVDTGEFNLQGDLRFTTGQVIRLAETENEALAGVGIDIGPATGTGYTLKALHVLDSDLVAGIGIIAKLETEDSASAEGGLESQKPEPEQKDDPGFFDKIKGAVKGVLSGPNPLLDTIFNRLTTKYYTPNASAGGSGASPSLGVSGSFAVNVVDHDVQAIVRPTAVLQSNEDLEVRAEIEEQAKQSAVSLVEPQEQSQSPNQNAVSVSVAVGVLTNTARVTIATGAMLDALRTTRLSSSVTYPFLTRPDEFVPVSLSELNDLLKNDPASLKDYADGTLGLKSKLFNTWVRALAKASKVGVAGAVNVLVFNNDAETTVQSGAQINQDTAWRAPDKEHGNNTGEQTVAITAGVALQWINVTGVFDKGSFTSLLSDPDAGNLEAAASANATGGVGGVLFLGFLTNTIKAVVEADAAIYSGPDGGFLLRATEATAMINLAQAGGESGGKLAIDATFQYLRQVSNTIALLSSGAHVTGREVRVYAGNNTTIAGWSGSVVKGEGVGIGVSVAINDVHRSTRAVIGGADLTATPSGGIAGTGIAVDVSEGVDVMAKHQGHLISLTVAGAVVSSQPVGGDAEDPLDGVSLPVLFGEAAPQNTPAKTGVGIAGAASVDIVDDIVESIVNDAGSIAAASLAVHAVNDAFVLAITGAGALTKGQGSQSSVSIAGAFSVITVTMHTHAIVQAIRLALAAGGDLTIEANRTGDLITASVGAAGATTDKGTAAAGSVSVTWLVNETQALLRNIQATTPVDAIAVTAGQSGQIIAIGGGFGYGTRNGVGASLGLTRLESTTTATIEGVGRTLAIAMTGALAVSATDSSTLRSIALSAGVGKEAVGVAFTIAVNLIASTVAATLSNATVTGAASVDVTAGSDAVIQSIGGAVGVGKEKAGFGAALGWNQVDSIVKAVVIDTVLDDIAGDVHVTATVTEGDAVIDGKISALSVAGGVSTGGGDGPNAAVAGALSINVVTSVIEASITRGAVDALGDVIVAAADSSTIRSLTGGFSFAGGTAAVGVGIAVNTITSTVRALLTDVSVVAGDDVSVTATNAADIQTIAIGLAVAVKGGESNKLSLTGAGSVSINTIDNTTEAIVSGGGVDAGGDLVVSATAASTILAIAGAIGVTVSGGNGAAFGISVVVNDVSNTVRAHIDTATVRAADVAVTAGSTVAVRGVAVAGSGDVATGSGSGLRISGAGAVVVNLVDQVVDAAITGSPSVVATTGDIAVAATAGGEVHADAGGVAIAVATGGTRSNVTVGAGVGVNDVANTVTATIDVPDNATISARRISVAAGSTLLVTVLALGIAGAATSGSGGGATFGGAGSGAGNDVQTNVKAVLSGGVVTTVTDLSVTATDATTIHADGGAVALVLARGPPASVAIGIAVASNHVTGTVSASVVGSRLTIGGGLTATATSSSTIESFTLAATGQVAPSGNGFGLGISGAGAIANNTIAVATSATLTGIDALVSGPVTVTATDGASITASVIAIAVAFVRSEGASVAVAAGVSVAVNTVHDSATATIVDSTVRSPAAVSVTASLTARITATAVGIAVAITNAQGLAVGLAFGAAVTTNSTGNQVVASVEGSTVTGSALAVRATNSSTIVSTPVAAALSVAISQSGAGVAVSISGSLAINEIADSVRAAIVDSTVDVTGAVAVVASQTSTITATAASVSVSVSVAAISVAVSGALTVAQNTIASIDHGDDRRLRRDGHVGVGVGGRYRCHHGDDDRPGVRHRSLRLGRGHQLHDRRVGGVELDHRHHDGLDRRLDGQGLSSVGGVGDVVDHDRHDRRRGCGGRCCLAGRCRRGRRPGGRGLDRNGEEHGRGVGVGELGDGVVGVGDGA